MGRRQCSSYREQIPLKTSAKKEFCLVQIEAIHLLCRGAWDIMKGGQIRSGAGLEVGGFKPANGSLGFLTKGKECGG